MILFLHFLFTSFSLTNSIQKNHHHGSNNIPPGSSPLLELIKNFYSHRSPAVRKHIPARLHPHAKL